MSWSSDEIKEIKLYKVKSGNKGRYDGKGLNQLNYCVPNSLDQFQTAKMLFNY